MIPANINHLFSFDTIAENHNLDPMLLYGLGSTSIQPVMETLGTMVTEDIRGNWRQRLCPVCSREAIIGKIIERKRFFKCNFCHTEYAVDYTVCNHCDNKDPDYLAYYTVTDKYGFEIDFCKKCSHYIKIINLDALPEQIPDKLEDIGTLALDYLAQEKGLKRSF